MSDKSKDGRASTINSHQDNPIGDAVPQAGEKWLAGFIANGPDKSLEQLRVLTAVELAEYERADALVRGIHRNTPYHQLEEAKQRYRASIGQAASVTAGGPAEGLARALEALREVLTIAVDQVQLWSTWIENRVGVWSGFDGADDDFSGDRTIANARQLLDDPGLALAVDDDPRTSRVATAENGPPQVVEEVFGMISWRVVTMTWRVIETLQDHLDAACRIVVQLASEVLVGDPVIVYRVGEGTESKLTFAQIDRLEVQKAQLFARAAKRVATDVANDGLSRATEASSSAPAERERPATKTADAPRPQPQPGPDTKAGDGSSDPVAAPDADPIAEQAPGGPEQSAVSAIPRADVDLRRVIEAIADNITGLAAEWSRRFPVDEYESLVEREKQLAASLVGPLLERLQLNDEQARTAGLDIRVDRYPPTLASFGDWRSDANPEQRWVQETTGSMMAFEHFTRALENLSRPSRLTVRDQHVQEIEFDPAGIALVQEAARLVVATTNEASRSASRLSGLEVDEPDTRTQVLGQWHDAATADAFSLAEAALLYAVRLARTLEKHGALDADSALVVDAAQAELQSFLDGLPSSRSVSFGLAGALLGVLGERVENLVFSLARDGSRSRQSGDDSPGRPAEDPIND